MWRRSACRDLMDRVRVDHLQLLADVDLGGQRQYLRGEGGVVLCTILEYPPKSTRERSGNCISRPF